MNVANFAQEFSQLLMRWRAPSTQNVKNTDNVDAFLTDQQISSAIQDVVTAILGVNIQISDNSSMKTPVSDITILTPDAPKIDYAQYGSTMGRVRSLDILNASPQAEDYNFPDNIPTSAKSEDDIEMMDTDMLEQMPPEKKFISRSSPAMHMSGLGRSDTFVRENEEREDKNNDKGIQNFGSKLSNDEFLYQLKTVRQKSMELIDKIDGVLKPSPGATKPIRRLSIGAHMGYARSSAMLRPVPLPKMRRSFTAIPGTPTSSRLNVTMASKKEESASSKRRTASTAAACLTPGTKSSVTPSKSSGTALSLSAEKKSPLSGGRPAKNPKYAHIQSTIPKALSAKRKAQ